MTRKEFIDKWMNVKWKKSTHSESRYVNVPKGNPQYNVAYLPDFMDNSVWVYTVRPCNEKAGGFSDRKFRTADEAKLAGLNRAADLLGLV